MRLTVGPLAPAVYWRRRAVVLGAGILFLIVLLYSCNALGNTVAGPEQSPSPTPPTSAGTEPTEPVLTPESGSPPEASADPEASAEPGTEATGEAPVPPGPASDAGTCMDNEISVIPVAVPNTARQGATVELRLKIKNISDRTCSRDVGADLQELFVKSGAEKVWSSDTCGTGEGSSVESFPPNHEKTYQVGWNSRDVSRCANGLAAGPVIPAGTYQVFGRLGTKLSDPVKLTIVA